MGECQRGWQKLFVILFYRKASYFNRHFSALGIAQASLASALTYRKDLNKDFTSIAKNSSSGKA